MTSLEFIYPADQPWLMAMNEFPTARGRLYGYPGMVLGRARLPTDSVGTFALTLTGLVVGSAIQIETATGAAIENRTAAATSEVFTVSAYTSGSANNNLRIKVRKGSASPFYLPYETLTTAFVGSTAIFVSQISDE